MADSAVFRVTVRGAGVQGRSMRAAARGIQHDIIAEQAVLGVRLKAGLAESVPHGPEGHDWLADSIEVVRRRNVRRPGFEIRAGALSEEGFNYLRVSRFGHRKSRIRPVRGTHLAIPVGALRRGADPGVRVSGDRAILSSVRGYRPVVDWVERGLADADRELDATAERLGRRVERRLLR